MSVFVFLYLVSLYLYLRICIFSENFSDFTWRPAAVCQGRELVRGHVWWESDLHSPLSSNSNSHLSSTLPGMITCVIFLVLALNHFNQADDAVSYETSTVCKQNSPAPKAKYLYQSELKDFMQFIVLKSILKKIVRVNFLI